MSLKKIDLKNKDLFKDLPAEVIDALEAVAELRTIRGGETFLHQGEQAIALYYVQSGRFRIVVDQVKVVASIGAGEIIGELAFFAGGVRTADVTATRDSVVLRVARVDYDRISNQFPQLNDALLRLISSRLVVSTARTSSMEETPPKVIALLGSGDGEIPEGFIQRLANALTAELNGKIPVQTMCFARSTANDSSEYEFWLSSQEAGGGYILVNATGSNRWSERVCRNADALLMIARPGRSNPDPSDLEFAAMQWIDKQQRSLILIRDELADQISGSIRWVEPRDPRIHHHLALDTEQDFTKVARFICGQAIGLVLAGGGALGCAHLGIVQALQEASIPIDFIGGTSAGAAMGCAIASGMSVADTLTQMEDMFINAKAMRRFTIPVHSLLDPTVFDQQLKLRYGDQDIVDQPINFFAVSTNLSTNSLHIHRRGPLWEAVRASGSLPTVLPPFIDNHTNILVDGGVLDNAPVAVMHEIKTGPNIVVSLADHREDWRLGVRYDQIRGRWKLLRDLLLRRKRDHEFPSIVEVMSRSMVIGSRMASKEMLRSQDCLICPPMIPGMQLFDWAMGRELAELARSYMQQELAENRVLATSPIVLNSSIEPNPIA